MVISYIPSICWRMKLVFCERQQVPRVVCFLELLLFPFRCFDAKGGEEYLSLS
jgi:hypothetical protein